MSTSKCFKIIPSHTGNYLPNDTVRSQNTWVLLLFDKIYTCLLTRHMTQSRLNIKHVFFWHSEDRASWYILTIKVNMMHYFSNLFWVDNIRMDLQEVGCGYVDWIGLAQDRDRWRTLVSAVMNLRVLWNAGDFLTSCKPVSCSRRTLHRGVSNELHIFQTDC